MRRHAEAPSAGSTSGGGTSLNKLGLLALALALALVALAPNANATILTRAKTASFGPDGTGLTSFGSSGSLAFDQAADRLYVLDRVEPAVLHAFNAPALTLPGGAFPKTLGTPGFRPPIAVDNTAGASAGHIFYLSHPGELSGVGTVDGFDSAGTALGGNFPLSLPAEGVALAVAVDSAGNLYVAERDNQLVKKFDAAGNLLGTISTSTVGGPLGIAFDSNDDLFFTVSSFGGGSAGVYKATAASGYSQASFTKLPWASQVPGEASRGIAVNTVSHTLYVADAKNVSAYNATTGTFLYEFAGGIANADFEGVTVDQGTDAVYVSDRGNDKVHVFSAAQNYADATAIPAAAKSITDTSAEIGATITDNNALPTSWRLEISADGGATWSTAKTGQTLGGQTGVAVFASLSGLDPNTNYKFRAVTNKGIGAATEAASNALFFTTVAPPPVISDFGAIQVADTSARLVGTIDPRNTDTGYVFQYGTTPALGSSTAPLDIGAGTKPITVSQLVGGLTPDTTYYFRLVATNLTGTTTSSSRTLHTRTVPFPPPGPGNCPNGTVRTEQSSTFLPDCRAYEMVTPPDKNQGDITNGQLFANFSADGTAVAFCAKSIFGEPAGEMANNCAPYISRRGAGGWSTSSPFPRYCRLNLGEEGSGSSLSMLLSSRSFDRAAISLPEFASCPFPPLDPAAPTSRVNTYREDMRTDPFSYDLIAPNGTGVFEDTKLPIGGSEDLSHVVYASTTSETPDSPAGDLVKLYDWEEEGHGDCAQPGGCLSLVSVDPNGDPFETSSNVPPYKIGGSPTPLPSAVSADGDRIYFYNEVPSPYTWPAGCSIAGCELYLREDGATTIQVSESECTANCGGASPTDFRWATAAGDKALFESCAKLTDASTEAKTCQLGGTPKTSQQLKLYRWDRSGPLGHRLVDLTVDDEPADGSQPEAVDVIGASTDKGADPESDAAPGNTVYFVAGGQLVAGEPAPATTFEGIPTPVGLKLYRWRWNGGSPSLDYLGSYRTTAEDGLPANDGEMQEDPNANRLHVRVTPDGRYVVIRTALALDPTADRDSDPDMYRWDEAGGWLCVSCQLPGLPSAGAASTFTPVLRYYNLVSHELGGHVPEHTISDDGQRIFFTTPDALVPQDVNGESGCPNDTNDENFFLVYRCADVYEWHDGTISLLSSGTGSRPFILLGATSGGEDVFFATAQRLLGRDADNGVDIYDAHVDGGFPEPAAQPPSCEAEACRGASSAAAVAVGAGTAVFEGPGSPPIQRHKTRKHHKKRHHKHQRANHNRRAGR